LARECGWDHNFIADNFTIEQIRTYYEIIQKQKLRDAQLDAISTLYATATAFGSMKNTDFKRFLDKFDMKPIDVMKNIDEMKAKGLPVEDK